MFKTRSYYYCND